MAKTRFIRNTDLEVLNRIIGLEQWQPTRSSFYPIQGHMSLVKERRGEYAIGRAYLLRKRGEERCKQQ